jgi:hypothetical protein
MAETIGAQHVSDGHVVDGIAAGHYEGAEQQNETSIEDSAETAFQQTLLQA